MRVGLCALVAGCMLTSCFIGYDSRWGQAERSQRVMAREATPPELQALPSADPKAARAIKTMAVRAYATPRFAAEVVDVEDYVTALLERANAVIEPTLSLRLRFDGVRPWKVTSEDDIRTLLDQLVATDPGEDVGWVMGLAGSVPRFEESHDVLGRAQLLGNHLVVRAMHDASEFDAIEEGFAELDATERATLYRARLRHKTTTVFLHELGHTLGVPHVRGKGTIMHPRYDSKVVSFSAASTRVMLTTTEQRVSDKPASRRDFALKLGKQLRDTKHLWNPEDYAQLRVQLGQMARVEPATVAATPPSVPGLRSEDQARFAQALELERQRRPCDALETASPLFSRYPDVYEIQDLRCRLALARGGSVRTITRKECAPLMRLVEEKSSRKGRP